MVGVFLTSSLAARTLADIGHDPSDPAGKSLDPNPSVPSTRVVDAGLGQGRRLLTLVIIVDG